MLHRKALTLKQLRALAAIVDAGSVTAAFRQFLLELEGDYLPALPGG